MGIRTVTDDSFQEAQAYFNAGNFRRCRELVLKALTGQPEDANLLKLAGKCSLALNLDDAAHFLGRAVKVMPDDHEAWRDLGDAQVEEGDLQDAAASFREALRLRPTDARALIDLGHIMFAMGNAEEGITCLSQAAQHEPGNLSTLRSLMDMYRRAHRLEDALATATRITNLKPDDVLGSIDVADLNLALGHLDAAVAAYNRLRQIDSAEEHEVYAYHGMIAAELRRDNWRRVLDLAVDATRVDRFGLTTDLLAFAVAQVFGSSDRPTSSRAEIDAALAVEQEEHRRLHLEDITL